MEDYATWYQEHELTEATVDALKDNGITSLKSASLLTAAHWGKLFCSSRASNP